MFSSLISPKQNALSVLEALIKRLKVPVSSLTLHTALTTHPDYPSLLSFSDCLTEWRIPNNAYSIEKADYYAADLTFPLIAYLQDSTRFILITSIANDKVIYDDELKTDAVMSEHEFLSKWGGVVLFAEPNADSGEQDYRAQKLKGTLNSLRIPALITAVLATLFFLFFNQDHNWSFSAAAIVMLAGIVVSTLLLMHSINASNPFIQNLCSLGNKNDCNAILKSKESQLTLWLSWSEVGFFYFSGSLLALLFVANISPYLAILNLCCLPYTIWSLWFQYKSKNWCKLCCLVQFLLWLQCLVFFTGISYSLPLLDTVRIFATIICFSLPVVFWAYIKPFLLKAEQIAPLKQQVKKFKYNSDLFNQVLTNQPRFSTPTEVMPIILGNAEAETIITMVSNPFCGPCATTHKTLDQWLNIRDDIQLKIIFTTANHDDDPRTQVARHLSALSLIGDKNKVKQALNDWYNSTKKDYNIWAKSYPVQDSANTELVTERQKEWCTSAEITFTPTILVNGYKLPEPYTLEDIKYLLN